MTIAPGSRIGPYEVTAHLGEGGMGVVFRGRDSRLQRDVALKLLPEHSPTTPTACRDSSGKHRSSPR